MNRPRASRPLFVGCLAAIAVFVAGCTSSTADAPTGSSGSGSLVAVSPSVADVSTSPTSPGPADGPSSSFAATSPSQAATIDPASRESADRAAIEAQWTKFWDVYIGLVRASKDERPDLAATVAVDPTLTNLLKSAENFDAVGRDNYGFVIHRPSFLEDIGGARSAVLSDCQDQSQFGSIDVASGKTLTVGVDRDNIKADFVKSDIDDIWRVREIYFLTDTAC